MITIINKPVFTEPFLDYLTATLDIKQKHWQAIRKFIIHLNEIHGPFFADKDYKIGVKIYLEDNPVTSPTMLIQCDPRWHSSTKRFLRVSFNPKEAHMAYVRWYLDSLLIIIGKGYEHFIHHARITRRDITIDVHNININWLLASYPGFKISEAYYNGHGDFETYYIGNKKESRRFFRIYDKRKQLKDKYPKLPFLIPDQEITRIEHVNRNSTQFSDLGFTKDPFVKLIVSSVPMITDGKDYKMGLQWKLFIDAARFKGAQATLLSLPEHVRKLYKSRMKLCRLAEWDAEGLWKTGWPKAVSAILNPPKLSLGLIESD